MPFAGGAQLGASGLMQEIKAFLKSNPNPTDEVVHDWAERNGFDTEVVEQTIYKLASAHVQETAQKINIEDQIIAGTKVEMEHTDDEAVAKQIAYDHLKEDPRYYIFLKEMEKLMKETASRTTYEKSVRLWQEKASGYKPKMKETKTPEGFSLTDEKEKELNAEKMEKHLVKEAKSVTGKVGYTNVQPKSALQKKVEKSSSDAYGKFSDYDEQEEKPLTDEERKALEDKKKKAE